MVTPTSHRDAAWWRSTAISITAITEVKGQLVGIRVVAPVLAVSITGAYSVIRQFVNHECAACRPTIKDRSREAAI